MTPTVVGHISEDNALRCPTPEQGGVENKTEFPQMPTLYTNRERPQRPRIDRTELAIRVARSESLADAIARAHPDDARAVLTAALIDLHKGMPEAAVFGSIREDARFWGSKAGEAELAEVCRACLDELPNRALHLDHRKKLMATLWRGLPVDARQAFMKWTQEEAA